MDPQSLWYELVTRLGRGSDLRPLDEDEALAEYQGATSDLPGDVSEEDSRSSSPHAIAACIEAAKEKNVAAMGLLFEFLRHHAEEFVARHVRENAANWTLPSSLVPELVVEALHGIEGLPQGAGEWEILARLHSAARSRLMMYAAHQQHESNAMATDVSVAASHLLKQARARARRAARARAIYEAEIQMHPLFTRIPGMSDVAHEVLQLRRLRGLTYEEIGSRLGLTRDEVRLRYRAALREVHRHEKSDPPQGFGARE